MRKPEAWRVIAGFVSLLLVVAMLLSTPSMFFTKSIAIVDTELRQQGASPQRVLTKFDFAQKDQLEKIPANLSDWRQVHQYAWDNVATILNTNVLLSRDYARPGLQQPVNMLIVESTNVSSFHPAPVCYRAQGWDVADEGVIVPLHVENATWAQPAWLSTGEPQVFGGNLTAKLLTATRSDANGTVVQERLALYVYLKKENWVVTNDVTWLRVEIAVPPGTPREDALPVLVDLLGASVPHVFSFEKGDEKTLAESIGARFGVAGYAGIGVLLASPLALIAASLRRRPEAG